LPTISVKPVNIFGLLFVTTVQWFTYVAHTQRLAP
jgi:hypothetical protein